MKTRIHILLFSLIFSQMVFSYDEPCTGMCGSDLEWYIADSMPCHLEITGVGSMWNFTKEIVPTYRFCGCQISAVSLPNGLVNIGDYAFANLTRCNDILLPATIRFIGKGAFMNSTQLYVNQMFAHNIISVGDSAFYGCKNLGGIGAWIKDTVHNATFYGTGATFSVIPSYVKYIGDYAFAGCNVGSILTIPNNVTYIGDSAFHDCSSLRVAIFDSESIINKQFAYNNNLSSIFGEHTNKYVISDNITAIGQYAFYKCNNLDTLVVGENVAFIGDYALKCCSSLKRVEWNAKDCSLGSWTPFCLPSYTSNPDKESYISSIKFGQSVKRIPAKLLVNQNLIEQITIPDSVVSIGEQAFYGCKGLEQLQLGCQIDSIETEAFRACTKLTSVSLPNSLSYMGEAAFEYCNNLKSVIISSNLTEIAPKTFMDCNSLSYVNIPCNVTTIHDSAFYDCGSLTSLTIPNSVANIARTAFVNVANIEYHGSASGAPWGAKSINGFVDGDFVYDDETRKNLTACSTIKAGDVSILNGVKSISAYAFKKCVNLRSVMIPNTVTIIGDGAFSGCSNLESIVLPDSLKCINENTFSNCKSMSSVNIPNNVTSIGEDAFSGCVSLTSITIPNSVTSINGNAFARCSCLTHVNIPNRVTYIGSSAFTSCTSLASVTIPNSVRSIGMAAFYGCSSLTSITIPNGVTKIDKNTFFNCRSLSSVSIPSSITDIGNQAFYNCQCLSSIVCEASIPPVLGTNVFKNSNTQCVLYVPAESLEAYRVANGWKEFGNILPISAQMTQNAEVSVIVSSSDLIVVEWPSIDGVDTYVVAIVEGSDTICSLNFDTQGFLLSVRYNLPSCNRSVKNNKATQTANGWQYIITGLDANKQYTYIITAKSNNVPVFTQSVVFNTSSIATSTEDVQDVEKITKKILRDGQIIIMRSDKSYTVMGQETR